MEERKLYYVVLHVHMYTHTGTARINITHSTIYIA